MSEPVSKLRQWVGPAQAVFTPLALAFLVFAAYRNRDVFADLLARANVGLLALTIVGWGLLHLLSPATTWLTLRGMGYSIGFTETLRIHLGRLPARYLPGGIWHTVSKAVDLHGRGVGRPALAALVLVENAAPLAAALVLGGAFSLAAGNTHVPGIAIILAGASLGAALPWLLARLIPASPRLPAGTYLLVLAAISAFWLAAGAAFACYLSAFPDTQLSGRLPDAFATYLLSWAAGFLAVFAPQGIGVFEAVASLLLAAAIPFGGMAVLVAGFRAIMLSGDLLAYLVHWLCVRAAAAYRPRLH